MSLSLYKQPYSETALEIGERFEVENVSASGEREQNACEQLAAPRVPSEATPHARPKASSL
jgi:hypothetical protein